MEDKKTCNTCFWSSRDMYCTEGAQPPRKCKEVCDKYTPNKIERPRWSKNTK